MHITNKRSLPEKSAYCMILTIWRFRKGKTTETIKRSVVVTGQGMGKGRYIHKAQRILGVGENSV